MQTTSALYRSIIETEPHWFETSVAFGESGKLITEYDETLLFGGTAIIVARGGGGSGYQESSLYNVTVSNGLFKGCTPSVGNAISAEINVEMLKPTTEIARMAQIVPYVRVTDGTRYSEWLQKGVFFIDTREETHDTDGLNTIKFHGYDTMLLADSIYDTSELSWNAKDIDVVWEIAHKLNIGVDERTVEMMDKEYELPFPAQYTMRETLGFIASFYGGNFIINEQGDLRLVALWDLLKETRYLITPFAEAITFGGDRILV